MAVKEASAAECKDILAAGATYLDVRTAEEFEAGHYKDATNIPVLFKESGGMVKNEGFLDAVSEAFKDNRASIVVSCKVGKRGGIAAEAMQGAGYVNVTNMEGGYDAWLAAGL